MATEIIESAVLTNSRYEKEDDYLSHRFFILLFENPDIPLSEWVADEICTY